MSTPSLLKKKENSLKTKSPHGIESYISSRCVFCNAAKLKEVEIGRLFKKSNVAAHYYCLLFSSGLEQNGEDADGIYGFLPEDILKEASRGRKLKCSFCNQKGATIGCAKKHCKKTYHFRCGLENGCQFIFTEDFSSFCCNHRTYQVAKRCSSNTAECSICLEPVPTDVKKAYVSPCCQKDTTGWFHPMCLKRLALSAGYFFKCPLCNDKNEFTRDMLHHGIYVPEQDASWEREPNAFQDLLERPMTCEVKRCKCPHGRKYEEGTGKWDIILCNLCGSTATHSFCSKTKPDTPWNCLECVEMLKESQHIRNEELRLKRKRDRSLLKEEAERACSDEEPEKKKQKRDDSFRQAGTSSTGLITGNLPSVGEDAVTVPGTSGSSKSKSSEFTRYISIDERINPKLVIGRMGHSKISSLEDQHERGVLEEMYQYYKKIYPKQLEELDLTTADLTEMLKAFLPEINFKSFFFQSFAAGMLPYPEMVALRNMITAFISYYSKKRSGVVIGPIDLFSMKQKVKVYWNTFEKLALTPTPGTSTLADKHNSQDATRSFKRYEKLDQKDMCIKKGLDSATVIVLGVDDPEPELLDGNVLALRDTCGLKVLKNQGLCTDNTSIGTCDPEGQVCGSSLKNIRGIPELTEAESEDPFDGFLVENSSADDSLPEVVYESISEKKDGGSTESCREHGSMNKDPCTQTRDGRARRSAAKKALVCIEKLCLDERMFGRSQISAKTESRVKEGFGGDENVDPESSDAEVSFKCAPESTQKCWGIFTGQNVANTREASEISPQQSQHITLNERNQFEFQTPRSDAGKGDKADTSPASDCSKSSASTEGSLRLVSKKIGKKKSTPVKDNGKFFQMDISSYFTPLGKK